jgi:hypothetical protein
MIERNGMTWGDVIALILGKWNAPRLNIDCLSPQSLFSIEVYVLVNPSPGDDREKMVASALFMPESGNLRFWEKEDGE